jgi:putative ABC transport system permease protein
MLDHFLKTAFRAFWKNKWGAFINIVGLAIGMSAALVIFLVARYDLTFDKFETGGDRIYRVVTNFTFSGVPAYNPGVCTPLPLAAKKEVSGLELVVPVYQPISPNVQIPSASKATGFRKQDNIAFTTPDYFNLIDYRWLAGSPAVLTEPYRTVLRSDQAELYFPGLSYDAIIGRTVIYDSIATTVAGIVAPLKENSGFTFHDLISYSTLLTNAGLRHSLRLNSWGATWVLSQCFVRLVPGEKPQTVTAQLNDLLTRNEGTNNNPHKTQRFALQPLADIHYNLSYGGIGEYNDMASKPTLYALMVIAVFLLLLACINFINLSTAQAGQRAKEVGIRKAIGSGRAQLIRQFLGETMLMTLGALALALLLAPNFVRLFAGFIPAGVHVDLRASYLWWFALILAVTLGLASGIYPALVLSGYKPVAVLKNQTFADGHSRKTMLRRSLTVFQFVIAQFFIIVTAMVSKQIYYATHKDLGFKKDAIVTLHTPFKTTSIPQNKLLLDRLATIPGVALVSLGHDAPSSDETNGTEASYKDGKKEIHMEDLAMKFGDSNYIRVYRIPLLAGRNLQPSDTGRAFLVNQAFLRRIGLQRPQEAVGKIVDGFNGNQRMTIVGVVGDFNEGSLHDEISPMVLMTGADAYYNNVFHIALPQESSTWPDILARIRKLYQAIYPDDPANLKFVDESVALLYEKEQHTAKLLRWATGLSILISCLGLLGLAIFTTAQRTKEIGVRKVLGASTPGIVLLLSKDIINLTILAFLIATPAAAYALNRWMADFADRTTISWWVFVLCGLFTTAVALLISAFQTVRAASANPVKSLRSE